MKCKKQLEIKPIYRLILAEISVVVVVVATGCTIQYKMVLREQQLSSAQLSSLACLKEIEID